MRLENVNMKRKHSIHNNTHAITKEDCGRVLKGMRNLSKDNTVLSMDK